MSNSSTVTVKVDANGTQINVTNDGKPVTVNVGQNVNTSTNTNHGGYVYWQPPTPPVRFVQEHNMHRNDIVRPMVYFINAPTRYF